MISTCVDTKLLPFDRARSILADAVETLSSQPIRLADALGRIAAESIVAKEDLVPYPRSAMVRNPVTANAVIVLSEGPANRNRRSRNCAGSKLGRCGTCEPQRTYTRLTGMTGSAARK